MGKETENSVNEQFRRGLNLLTITHMTNLGITDTQTTINTIKNMENFLLSQPRHPYNDDIINIEKQKYCGFHNSNTHNTIECRAKKNEDSKKQKTSSDKSKFRQIQTLQTPEQTNGIELSVITIIFKHLLY